MAIPDQNYDMNDNNTNGSTEACKVESRGGGSLIAEVFPGFGTGVSRPPTTTALKSTMMKTPNGLTIKKKTKENVFFSCEDIRFKQVSRSTEAVDFKTVRPVNTEKEYSLNGDNKEVIISASTRVTIANNEP